MAKRSRRSFLKSATAAAAALSVSGRAAIWAAPAASPVKVWSTHQDKRHAAGEPLAWKPAGSGAGEAIVLDASKTKQEILGFGAAMTDASCYVLSRLNE